MVMSESTWLVDGGGVSSIFGVLQIGTQYIDPDQQGDS
jgi:hypothetical protein